MFGVSLILNPLAGVRMRNWYDEYNLHNDLSTGWFLDDMWAIHPTNIMEIKVVLKKQTNHAHPIKYQGSFTIVHQHSCLPTGTSAGLISRIASHHWLISTSWRKSPAWQWFGQTAAWYCFMESPWAPKAKPAIKRIKRLTHISCEVDKFHKRGYSFFLNTLHADCTKNWQLLADEVVNRPKRGNNPHDHYEASWTNMHKRSQSWTLKDHHKPPWTMMNCHN